MANKKVKKTESTVKRDSWHIVSLIIIAALIGFSFWLLSENDRLDQKIRDLEHSTESYHGVDKETNSTKKKIATDVVQPAYSKYVNALNANFEQNSASAKEEFKKSLTSEALSQVNLVQGYDAIVCAQNTPRTLVFNPQNFVLTNKNSLDVDVTAKYGDEESGGSSHLIKVTVDLEQKKISKIDCPSQQ